MDTVIETIKFDTLYGLDKNGKQKTWEIRVEKRHDYSDIVTMYGYKRMIETRRRVNTGKNAGKKNATTHFQQAILEAKSKWTKKKDIERFTVTMSIESLEEKLNDTNLNEKVTSVVQAKLPMLAQDFHKQKNKVKYPCYVQCKLDGYRCLYDTTTKQITTRQGKEFTIVKQSGKLYEELLKLPPGFILDGELYTSSVTFETLGVLRKTKELTTTDKLNLSKIEYHIYDLIDESKKFEERNTIIKNLLSVDRSPLVLVPTIQVTSEEEIKQHHSVFLKQGFEGTMIRNKDSLYKVKQRSSDLLKYKEFLDEEFTIVDYTFEKDTSGKDENLIVWIVKTDRNAKCKVRPQGVKEERQELYSKCVENFNQFKGRKLWTKFFEYTNDGSLRFPTTKSNTYTSYIRDEII